MRRRGTVGVAASINVSSIASHDFRVADRNDEGREGLAASKKIGQVRWRR
jgi:hypothetical protein